jgi:hypothetical protein
MGNVTMDWDVVVGILIAAAVATYVLRYLPPLLKALNDELKK